MNNKMSIKNSWHPNSSNETYGNVADTFGILAENAIH